MKNKNTSHSPFSDGVTSNHRGFNNPANRHHSTNPSESRNNNVQQYRVLYTNQKTKKRKLWTDGKLTYNNAEKKCRLYEACPLPGTVGGGVVDEIDLCGQQVAVEAGMEELESEKYLIRIEGPWNDQVDGRNGSTVRSRPNSGGRPGGGMGMMAGGSNALGSAASSTANSTVVRSDGMKKLLSNKYRMPPKVMPLHPEDRRRRDNSLAGRGGNAPIPGKKMPPLQPGELERRYFGTRGSEGGGGSFGYDNERYGYDERRGAGISADGGGYSNFHRNGNTCEASASAGRGIESRSSFSGYSNNGKISNYDENRRAIQSNSCNYYCGRIGGTTSQNTSLSAENIQSRTHNRLSLNNEGIDQRNPGCREYDWDKEQQQQGDGRRQPSNPRLHHSPPAQRSHLSHANESAGRNVVEKENDICENAHQSFVVRACDDGVSSHHTSHIGGNTSRFISDGYDASRLYEEEDSDSGNDDDEHYDVGVGGHDTVGGRDDVRNTLSHRGNGTAVAVQNRYLDGNDDGMPLTLRDSTEQENATSIVHRQLTSNPAVSGDDPHATDELLELLGLATPVAAAAIIPHPSEEDRRGVETETPHSQRSSAEYRPKSLVCYSSDIDNNNDSSTGAVGWAQNDDNQDQESSFLAGIIRAETQLQDRADVGSRTHLFGASSATDLSSNGFGGWQHRNYECGERFDGQNEFISNEDEVFSRVTSDDVAKTNPNRMHLNNGQDKEEMGTATFSGFTLPSADESTSSSDDED